MNEFRVTLLYKSTHPWSEDEVALMVKADLELGSRGNVAVSVESVTQVRDSS
jgi:hypothetical protein